MPIRNAWDFEPPQPAPSHSARAATRANPALARIADRPDGAFTDRDSLGACRDANRSREAIRRRVDPRQRMADRIRNPDAARAHGDPLRSPADWDHADATV